MAEHLKLRMICTSVEQPYDSVVYVTLHAVYSPDKSSPNYSFSQATPSAELRMAITNPAAFDFYKKGHEYDFDVIDGMVATMNPGPAAQYAVPKQTAQEG